MKKNIALFILFILCSCNEKKNELQRNTSVVDFDSDSIFYKIDLSQADNNTTFLIVKNIYVNDSCFGNFSINDNRKRASEYCNTTNGIYYYMHELFAKNKSGYRKLWNIKEDFQYPDRYFDLEADTKYHTEKNTNSIITDYTFLKIIRKQKGFSGENLSLNFKLNKDLSWELLSKERIVTDKNLLRTIGYCKDTVTKQLNENPKRPSNEINFNESFNLKFMICNEGLNN